MELRQLRYFIAVVEEANFTRAAETVFVSQSALSQQIQSLEQDVGTLLLNRSNRGVHLTAAGEILYRHAQQVMLELEQAEIAIQELEGLQRGELKVGVVQTVNDYLIPALATRFRQTYPNVKLSVDEIPAEEIQMRLEQGTLQVGLGFTPIESDYLTTLPLFEEDLVLIVREDHPIAHNREVKITALDAMPMVMLARTFCTRQLWEESANLSNAQPQIMMEMNTVSSILEVVKTTGLATILPQHTLAGKPIDGLTSLTLIDPKPSRQVSLLWHKDHYLCAASRAFIDLAKQANHLLSVSTMIETD